MNFLITGASGFVGSAAALYFSQQGHYVRATSRTNCFFPSSIDFVRTNCLDSSEYRNNIFSNIDCVVHCAARVHVMREKHVSPLDIYRQVNVHDTLSLARLASQSGVRRFIYLSSIKVNGEDTNSSSPFTESDTPCPQDFYAISKYESEIELTKLALETGLDLIVIRPPLIYGPGVKGNFRALINLVLKGVPLPLASVTSNKRSFLSLGNLVHFLLFSALHPAPGSLYLLSDQHDVSTSELLYRLYSTFGTSSRLFPVPLTILDFLSKISFSQSVYSRLCSSLVVDSSLASVKLGWSPPLSLDSGFNSLLRSSF